MNESQNTSGRKRRRGRRRRNPQQKFEDRAEQIFQDLEQLARELWQFHANGHANDAVLPSIDLNFKLMAEAGETNGGVSGAKLVQELLSRMESHYRPEGYREGRVYCFLCESPDCEHASPPDAKSVFIGYGTNGKPEWNELSNVMLKAGESRVDQLFTEKPLLLALAQDGELLRSHQMAAFGRESRTHHVLGQVIAGYFRSRRDSSIRWAVSLQAVEYRNQEGRPEVGMNVINSVLGTSGLTGILTKMSDEWLYSTVTRARSNIAAIGRGASPDGLSERGKQDVLAVLHDLARFLEKNSYHSQSRTRHAREERTRQDRPIAAALKDLSHARPENFCIDSKTDTMVIIGPHRRTHIFNMEGKLVTSINYEGDEIRKKLQTHRWRPAAPDEIASFRQAVEEFRSRARRAGSDKRSN